MSVFSVANVFIHVFEMNKINPNVYWKIPIQTEDNPP